jgi:primary-amine oxidase
VFKRKKGEKDMKNRWIKTTVTLGTAFSLAFAPFPSLLGGQIASAHGSEALDYVKLRPALEQFGASVKWDQTAETIIVTKGSITAQVKLNSNEAIVNGSRVLLTAPVTFKNGASYITDEFINDIFQSELEPTIKVTEAYHPLNPLTPSEIESVIEVLEAEGKYKESLRFTEISIKEPIKGDVWAWAFSKNKKEKLPREAAFIALDGKQVIEGEVNLKTNKLTKWEEIASVHGMFILDDFITAQEAIESSEEYAEALKKRGIDDPTQVVATPLSVGYFGGEDGLEQDLRLLKVVSYLNTGDGNFWAHPIEDLVAVVDITEKKVIEIQDDGVIPVPMQNNSYDGRNFPNKETVKPLKITEPEGTNYSISGNEINWQDWDFHIRLDTRVGPVISTVTYDDQGNKRKVMYEGSLGGMLVPYGDPDVGWYFKSYMDSGEYGLGALTSSLELGTDVPENTTLLDATIADNSGNPYTIPNAIGVFERYAGPEFKHADLVTFTEGNQSRERRELVVRFISTIGNYDYIFDWVFLENGSIKIDVGASGIEAVKGVKSRTMDDPTAKEDTKYGTLVDHNIVGTTHQHIYNFRLDMDVDGENNSFKEINPMAVPNTEGGPRKSVMVTEERMIKYEQDAVQKFDPSTIRLLVNPNKTNKVGNPVGYQIIPFAGGTHPIAKDALFTGDDWLLKRAQFMDKHIWITNYNAEEWYPEGEYPNRSTEDNGLSKFVADNGSIENTDNVVWITTGATHVTRAEEWPIMPTEWVNAMIKPWNFFDQTPTLDLPKKAE